MRINRIHDTLRAVLSVGLLSFTLGLVACGGEDPTGPPAGGNGGGEEQVATVEVTPGADTLTALGDTRELQAVARDTEGEVVTGVDFTWSSTDDSVVTVDDSGVVTAQTNGTAEITASVVSSEASGSAALAVSQRVETVTVSPESATLTTVNATQEFTAEATDANGSTVEDARFVWSSEDHSVATIGPDGTATASGSGASTITATAQDIPGHAALTVNQEIASLSFRVDPSNAVAGEAIDPAIQVEVLDGDGAVVEDADLTISLELTGQQGSDPLRGSGSVRTVNGVAQFSGLSVTRVGSGYTLTATTEGSVPEATSDEFEVSAGPASQVSFAGQPPETTAGSPIGPTVEVRIEDAFGNIVTSGGDPVSVGLGSNPGDAVLGGVREVTPSGGVATFDDLVIETAADGYRLRAWSDTLESDVTGAFAVVPAAASRLAFTEQPTDIEGQVDFAPALEVTIQDEYGNRVPSAEHVIGLQHGGGGPGSAELLGTLSVTATDGVAEFSDVSVDLPGEGYAIEAYADGLTNATSQPFAVELTFDRISAGGSHTCGITVANRAYCWGLGSSGQLGDGGTESRATPVAVSGGFRFAQISAGGAHTCAVTLAILPTLWCWGSIVGDGSGSGALVPTEVSDPESGSEGWAEVRAGNVHTCGRQSDGTVYCWGTNVSGELGTGSPSSSTVPVAVQTSASFVSLSAGEIHTCGITDSDTLMCWGDNAFGQVGDGTTTNRLSPVTVSDPPDLGAVSWAAVTAGSAHTCGLANTGSGGDDVPVCWGQNSDGELGDGTNLERTEPVVVGISVLAAVSAGWGRTCGVTPEHQPHCWGDNEAGQLGDGTTEDRSSPTPVFTNLSMETISAGSQHACALTVSGEAYCWGDNTEGQLGDGTVAHRMTPARVAH